MNLCIVRKDASELPYEFVERKGKGHPDTLSDNLAEYLSGRYSLHTRERFGAILHHNFDKVGLLGGASDVGFGYGRLTKPIRVLLNGRASSRFGDEAIDVRSLLERWATEFLCSQLPLSEPERELEFHHNLSTQSSPGKTEEEGNQKRSARKHWFEPRGLEDIPELRRLFSNDTSMGVGFYPPTKLESLVLEVERTLNGDEFRASHPWIGSDIKIMGFRHEDAFRLTMCIPQIGARVRSIEEYAANLALARQAVLSVAERLGVSGLELDVNTRDDYEKVELYLTAIGSSIESGDEGLVGRGNRIQGVISPTRLMSMEGAAGKNPVYHIGKIYYIAAQRISEAIHARFGVPSEVALVSQSGRDLLDPWVAFVHVPEGFADEAALEELVRGQVASIPGITEDVINGRVSIC